MAIKKFSEYVPVLASRGNGESIEVWQTEGGTVTGGRQEAFSQEVIRNVETGEDMYYSKHVDTGHEAQAELARQLADMPLRGDQVFTIHEGKILEGVLDEFYNVDGVQYASMLTRSGDGELQRIGMFMDTVSLTAQQELREQFSAKHDVLKTGSATLHASGIREPMAKAESVAGMITSDDIPKKTPVDVPVQGQEGPQEVVAAEVAPQAETEAEMYARFSREANVELQQLYKEHREARPGSDRMYQLEAQIRYAKEDAGKYARLAAKANGNTNWL